MEIGSYRLALEKITKSIADKSYMVALLVLVRAGAVTIDDESNILLADGSTITPEEFARRCTEESDFIAVTYTLTVDEDGEVA